MLSTSLLSFLSLAILVAANPVVVREPFITLPLAKQFNITSADHILKADQARAAALIDRVRSNASGKESKRAVIGINVENQAVTYVANVNVGNPATSFSLLIDTGSSNTWVGATKQFRQTGTTTVSNDRVSVTYGSGSFSGTEVTDTVSLGGGLTISKQSIGVASRSQGFQGVDGILGIGPVALTQGTLNPDTNNLIPTVTDNLFSLGTITANEIGVSFNPTNQADTVNGELTFGGTDSTKFTGPISFAPITRTFPASEFWGIDESITYGTANTPILSSTAGIVDTGTTLVLLASDAFARYTQATGAVNDRNTGLLRLSNTQFGNLQSLFFHTAGTTFELTPNAQIWPRALNTLIGGNNQNVYLIVNNLGTPTGQGLDFINGFTFLERFYSVFDTTNKRVGFATTPNTISQLN